MYQSLIFFLGTMILIRSLTFTFLWCFEKTRSSGMNEALLFNYSFSISRSSKSLITDLARWSVDLRWVFENWCFIHLRWSCSYQLPNSFKRCLKFFQVHIQKYVSPRHNKKCYGSLQAVDKIKYGNYTDLLMAEIESGKAITTKKWNRIWI